MLSFEDIQEFAQLMQASGIHPMNIDDLNRCMANSVLSLMAIGEGKLGEEPPHGPTLHLLLASMRDQSTLDDANKIPDRWSNVLAEQMAYAQHYSNFMVLCRLAKVRLPGALQRLATAFSPPTTTAAADVAKRDEAELKDAHSVAVRLRGTSATYYNVNLGTGRAERQASPEQLVKTHQGLRRGVLAISRLQSPKYGTATAVERDDQALTIQKGSGLLVQSEDALNPVNRYASCLLALKAMIDSFVEAGLVEIDPTKQTQVGAIGRLSDGRQVQFDMQTGIALFSAYLAMSDVLTSKQMVAHFESHFIPAVTSDMAGGHSLASATMNHLAHSSWMSPGESAVSMVGHLGASTATLASKGGEVKETTALDPLKAKFETQKTHYAKQESDMKAKIAKLEGLLKKDRQDRGGYNGGGGGGRYNEYRGGDRDRNNDRGNDRDRK